MEINVRTIAAYVEKCGVKSILQTKPNELKCTTPKLDRFVRSNPFFCRMTVAENTMLPKTLQNTKAGKRFSEIIPQIYNKKIEKAYYVSTEGEIIAESRKGKRYLCELSDKDCKLLQERAKTFEIHAIHNHPDGGTLSAQDLIAFFCNNCETMMAVSPNGSYAFLSKNKNLGNLMFSDYRNNPDLESDIKKVIRLERNLTLKLQRQGSNNFETEHCIQKMRHEQLQVFAEKYNLNYEYKEGLKPMATAPDNFKSDGKFYTKLIRSSNSKEAVNAFFKQLDETPLEKFFE